jgi:hypothetical protein
VLIGLDPLRHGSSVGLRLLSQGWSILTCHEPADAHEATHCLSIIRIHKQHFEKKFLRLTQPAGCGQLFRPIDNLTRGAKRNGGRLISDRGS